jgi:MraZ protein
MREVARHALGDATRWVDIHWLNPGWRPEYPVPPATVLRLPADARVEGEPPPWQPVRGEAPRRLPGEAEGLPPLRPVPAGRLKAPARAKAEPFTGTHPCALDDRGGLVLPPKVREQLGNPEQLLLTPGPDACLWLCGPGHWERLAERLGRQSGAARARLALRLYFAQTEKAAVDRDARLAVPAPLARFAGLGHELMVVGAGDHFEVWDAGRWRQYAGQGAGPGRPGAASGE